MTNLKPIQVTLKHSGPLGQSNGKITRSLLVAAGMNRNKVPSVF